MVRIVSLSVLLTLIVVLGLTFFRILAPFLLPLFLAAVFAILCQPIYEYFLKRTNQRVRLAAGMTAGSVVSIILVPLIVGTILASLQLFVLATDLSDRRLGQTLRDKTDPILQVVADFVNARMQPEPVVEPESVAPARIREELDSAAAGQKSQPRSAIDGDPDHLEDRHLDAPAATADTGKARQATPTVIARTDRGDDAGVGAVDENVLLVQSGGEVTPRPPALTAESLRRRLLAWMRESVSELGSKSLGMAGGTFDFLSGSIVAVGSAALAFLIFAVALYYFLADGTQLVRATERLIPVHVEYQRQMLSQFSRVVRAVVMATFFAALAQAIATVAALAVFGFEHLFIIFVVALLMSMIPMMGTWLVWLPCAGYLLYQGHWFQALLLTVYGAAFVGMLDNVVRTYVLNTDVKLHPLLALISVLGGLQVMGLWGMFVGPIVASCLHALVKIFNLELAALSQERFSGIEGSPGQLATETATPQVISPAGHHSVAEIAATGQNGAEEDPPRKSAVADG